MTGILRATLVGMLVVVTACGGAQAETTQKVTLLAEDAPTELVVSTTSTTSTTSTPGTLISRDIAANSSSVYAEILTTNGGIYFLYSGSISSRKYSIPFPGNPIDWIMPTSVSAILGVGLPTRNSRETVLATIAPRRLRSIISAKS